MKIERVWSMPNKWTFKMKPVKEFLVDEGAREGLWVDPFSGKNSPAEYTNDMNPNMPAKYHMDALKFLESLDTDMADGVLFDPPYSVTQAKVCYDSYGVEKLEVGVTNSKYWALCRDEVARVVKPGGKCISFGWNSNGMGMCRDFKIYRILLIAHGSIKNDTIVTAEIKEKTFKEINLF